jgi:hypothetical protein
MSSLMNIPPTDYEMYDTKTNITEKEFCSRADLQEGVSGCKPIETRFENTERTQVIAPRSDSRPRDSIGYAPAPRNGSGHAYGGHNEWDSAGPYIPVGGPTYGDNG